MRDSFDRLEEASCTPLKLYCSICLTTEEKLNKNLRVLEQCWALIIFYLKAGTMSSLPCTTPSVETAGDFTQFLAGKNNIQVTELRRKTQPLTRRRNPQSVIWCSRKTRSPFLVNLSLLTYQGASVVTRKQMDFNTCSGWRQLTSKCTISH